MDLLTEVLSSLRVSSTIFSRAELCTPWAVSTQGAATGIFHAVVTGGGTVRVAEGRAVPLKAGEVVLIPHGDPHVLSDGTSGRAVPIRSLPAEKLGATSVVRIRGPGPQTVILCGTFRFESTLHPLMRGLPRALYARGQEGAEAQWMKTTLQMMADEAVSGRPGAPLMLTRLSDVLLVRALRAHVNVIPENGRGWLAAVRDPQVARALGLIHQRPDEDWTADSMAEELGMSRSAFFERFRRLVGEPPASYLARWRIHLAARALVDEGAGLKEAAERVGYSSEAALSKAFKRITGKAPGEFRRERGAA
ncbi:MAG: AraC family transcriptional regulator [Myxococcota bacterium]